MIHGNIDGIKNTLLQEMEALYQEEIPRDRFAPVDLLVKLAEFTGHINREISIYISRAGEILDVSIGSLESVPLPDVRLRRNLARLSGVRCIHTHPGGDPRLSDVDLSSLIHLRCDAMAAVGVLEGKATGIQAAFLGERVQGIPQPIMLPAVSIYRLPQEEWLAQIEESDKRVMQGEEASLQDSAERAVLVGMESEDSLKELAALADTAGAEVVGQMLQRRDKPDNATYIGSGKAEELALSVQALDADLVIFDDELTGAQTRNLENILHVKVIDRTTLILDIFAQRAKTREGKLQVELAQMHYQLPRLIGQGLVLSRLGAGIGTRGPGESKLEISRRRIRERMTDLRAELGELTRQRDMQRNRRKKNEVPVVAIVGYTNTGKSTLLNALSGADVLAENKLFATLDPVTRRLALPDGGECLIVDTVGFIRKLPTTLVDAFRSTLEEAALADLLLVVSDASSPDLAQQREAVATVLGELGAGDKPTLEVWNKMDIALPSNSPTPALTIAAAKGEGLDALKAAIAAHMHALRKTVTLLIPYAMGSILPQLHEEGQVLSEDYEDGGTKVHVRLTDALLERVLRKLGPEALLV